MNNIVAPSILSADFANLGNAIEMLNRSAADWVHVDVMDGVFVPNISFGFPVIERVKAISTKPLDVHLMIVQPERYIVRFKEAGTDILSIHFEACNHLHRSVQEIKACGMKAGIAINPHTPVSQLEEIIEQIDLVCLMSVNPGYGGQKFITNTYNKVRKLRKMIDQSASSAKIEIDGGVGLGNAAKLIECGADVLVAGNSVFESDNPFETIRQLKEINYATAVSPST